MNPDAIDEAASEVTDLFAEMLERQEYFTVVAGAALALAGIALDFPPDADLTEDERAELEKLFDKISEPLKAVIKSRMKDMGVDVAVAAN